MDLGTFSYYGHVEVLGGTWTFHPHLEYHHDQLLHLLCVINYHSSRLEEVEKEKSKLQESRTDIKGLI